MKVFSYHGRRLQTKKAGDVGHDLYVKVYRKDQTTFDRIVSRFVGRRCMIIWPLVGVRTIRSGVYLHMPGTIWAEVRPRSSTSRRKLNVLGGTIDSGYHGEMFTVLHNLGMTPRIIKDGERYAQVVFFNAVRPNMEYIDGQEHEGLVHLVKAIGGRADDGFGSTGA